MKTCESQICDDLLRLLTKFKACLARIAEDYGLTQVQAHALYVLHTRGSLPMGQMAGALHCDASNVTGIIDRLVAGQLVERREDPEDRRTKQLQLTAKGVQIIGEFSARLPRELGLQVLDGEDCDGLHGALQKLLADS